MKILKPGKVEMRKFVCPNCECIFVAHGDDVSEGYVACPQQGCGIHQLWDKGEPYEEPKQDRQDNAMRLYELMKETWPYSVGALNELSLFLAAHGVTFKEDA